MQTDSSPARSPTATKLRALLRGRDGPDRGTKLLSLCREVWTMLQDDANTELIEDFIALLQDYDDLALARLTLPELRSDADAPKHALQREVVEAIHEERAELRARLESKQTDFDRRQPFYAAEKRTLLRSGGLSAEEDDKLKDWLAACPIQAACD
jgi:hypothetical protein